MNISIKYKGPGSPDAVDWAESIIRACLPKSVQHDIRALYHFVQEPPPKDTEKGFIWDQPTFRMTVSKTDEKLSYTWLAKAKTEQQALDDLLVFQQTFIPCNDRSVLPGHEMFQLMGQGRKAVLPYKIAFQTMPDQDKRDFVAAYCGGQIFADFMCHNPHDLSMVFMVIAFGALAIDEKTRDKIKDQLPPDPGPEPEEPDKPSLPKELELPGKPAEPKPIEPDPNHLREIDSRIDWQLDSDEAKEAYLADIETKKTKQKKQHAKALKEWEKKVAEIETANKEAKQQYEASLVEHEKKVQELAARKTEWDLAKARYDAAWVGVNQTYLEDLGLIWENLSQAGPRSMNGMPMFFSCHLMGKSDWEGIKKVLRREMKRRGKMKV